MHTEHPADLAQLLQTDAYDGRRLTPVVAPGSLDEAAALDEIDAAREEESAKLGETFESRQRSRARYWRPRGARP